MDSTTRQAELVVKAAMYEAIGDVIAYNDRNG
jgi:hypothetical protein